MIKSYESCNWIIKIWRGRWYIYAIYLYIKDLCNITHLIDYMLDGSLESTTREELRNNWKIYTKHVELHKMFKFSSK